MNKNKCKVKIVIRLIKNILDKRKTKIKYKLIKENSEIVLEKVEKTPTKIIKR